MKRIFGVWVIFFIVIIYFYKNAFHSYFEGDEWYYFSIFLPLTHHPLGLLETFIKSFTESNSISGGGHVAPFYNVIWFLENKFFGLNFKYYMLFSLVTHTTNSFLLFILSLRLTNKKILSFLSGLIFAIACVHYEAITWVMAVVPTQISLMFTLLGLICFVAWGRSGAKISKMMILSMAFFLAGIVTKETVILVVLLAPILLLPFKRNIVKRASIFSIITMLIYLPIRFGIPILVDRNPVHVTHLPIQSLILYQLLLIERMITEVFVSSNILLVVSRYISVHIYLNMSSGLISKESLELFSQSIGADILLLALSPIFFGICFVVFKNAIYKKKNYEILLFSVAVILTSAIPLLFILNYAPWWIDGAFIDSRHLYLPSIGASILLAFGFFSGFRFFAKRSKPILGISFFAIILLGWVWVQYAVIHKQTEKFENLSMMRQALINSVLTRLDPLPKRAVILVESDTPYFGFGQIPPFQTNLGQVLALTYFEKNQLPSEFFTNAQYMSKGILGEGFVTSQGRVFGYYLHKSSLLRDLKLGKFQIEDIYGFLWKGENNELVDKTDEIRTLAHNYSKEIVAIEKWNSENIPDYARFLYPQDSELTPLLSTGPDDFRRYDLKFYDKTTITIEFKKKSSILPFHEFLAKEKKSYLIPQNAEYYIKNIYRVDGSTITAVYIKSGDYVRYFVPFGNGTDYLEVSTLADVSQNDRDIKYFNHDIELFLSTMYF